MRIYSTKRKTKDSRKRYLKIIIPTYSRPRDPELAARWDANEHALVDIRIQMEKVYAPHRDANGELPETVYDDEGDVIFEFTLPPDDARKVEELAKHLRAAEANRTCGCLKYSHIVMCDWVEKPLYSTLRVAFEPPR